MRVANLFARSESLCSQRIIFWAEMRRLNLSFTSKFVLLDVEAEK
jgi:hypothetical protein